MHNQPLADRLPILTTSDILMAISQKEPLMAVQTLPRPFDAGHGGAVYVPVAIPEDIDPAEVSSLVEAIQKAMVVLTHGRQGDVTTRADRIAELASGLLEPSQELLEDRVHRMQTLHQVFATGDWLTSDQLHALQADPPKSKSQPASDWKRRGGGVGRGGGGFLGVGGGGGEYFARYQFDAMYEPLPVIRDVLKEFGDVADAWVLAAWFHFPNGWIVDPNGAPVAPKDALDRRDDLIRAARRRNDSYVA